MSETIKVFSQPIIEEKYFIGQSKNQSDYTEFFNDRFCKLKIYIEHSVKRIFYNISGNQTCYTISNNEISFHFGCQNITQDEIKSLHERFILKTLKNEKYIKKGSTQILLSKVKETEKYYIHNETQKCYLKSEYSIIEKEPSSFIQFKDNEYYYKRNNYSRTIKKEHFELFLEYGMTILKMSSSILSNKNGKTAGLEEVQF